MNREDIKVVPFRTAASPYNAETEKNRNVIGQQLAKAVRDCGYSKKAFCEVLKNYGVDVTYVVFNVSGWIISMGRCNSLA